MICHGKVINKKIISPGMIFIGLNISLNFLEISAIKNIAPKGIITPGSPFAITANPEKK